MAEVRLSIDQVDAYVRELHQVAAAMVAAGLPAGAVDGIADELQDLATEAIREEVGLNK
jgi:endonuclease YncB( thermonuclease family)